VQSTGRLRLIVADVGGPPTWSQTCEEFLEELRLRQYSPHTVTWYRSVLAPFGRFLREQTGGEDPSAANGYLVTRFLTQMSQAGPAGRGPVGARRLNHYRQGAHIFYEWLRSRGYVSDNPWATVPKAREGRKIIAALTETRVRALLQQPDRARFVGLRDYLFMLLLLDTGLRLSEALGLKLVDLDTDQALAKVTGKGNKERLVGLSARLVAELHYYLRVREKALAAIGMGASPWVFPNDVGGKLCAKTMQQHMRQYGEMAGITGVRVSPHTLRHTFAISLVRSGGDPFHLQKILGHASLEMTRRYCELADEDALRRQRELSPVETMDLGLIANRRVGRRPIGEWRTDQSLPRRGFP